MNGDFVKVFDIADSGFRSIGFALSGFLFVGIGLIVFFLPKILMKLNLQKTKERTKFQKNFRYLFLGFALFGTSTALISTYYEYASLRDADCKTVEGNVENFDPMPCSGHKHESYTVQGVKFEYSDYKVTNGFNNTASHGGPVNKDSVVRICYVPKGSTNIITKLEVKGYNGPIKDYSGGFDLFDEFKQLFDLFDEFKQLDEDKKSGKFKEMKKIDEAMAVGQKYMVFLMPMYIVDLVLYILFFVPFFNLFFKAKTLEHDDLEIDRKVLDQEKHTLENLTVKYDGEGVLWGRSYGIEIFQSPGCALKMYLSKDKTKVVKSEIRMSSLMFLTFFLFACVGVKFFGAAMSGSDMSKAPEPFKFFPYVMFLMIPFGFWMLKGRFQKKVNQFQQKIRD